MDDIIHRWLRLPYKLHANVRSPKGKPVATLLFIHGIGNSGEAWDDVIDRLPRDIRIVTIDLLGFGESPRPDRASYSAKTQAQSVFRALIESGVMGRITIVGHSLGSLVAIEMAKRYPLIVESLILCSPPLYKSRQQTHLVGDQRERLLKDLYNAAYKRPETFLKITAVVMKYELINKAFNVTDENVDSYMAALRAAVINQTSLDDIKQLKLPITILRGRFDPVLVPRTIRHLARHHPNIHVQTVMAGHEVRGHFVGKLVSAILNEVKSEQATQRKA